MAMQRGQEASAYGERGWREQVEQLVSPEELSRFRSSRYGTPSRLSACFGSRWRSS